MKHIKEYLDYATISDDVISNIKDVLDDADIEDYKINVIDFKNFTINILGTINNKEFIKPFFDLSRKLHRSKKSSRSILKLIMNPNSHKLESDFEVKNNFGNKNEVISRICKLTGFSFLNFKCPYISDQYGDPHNYIMLHFNKPNI